ncbi:MAG: hypothetical protein AAFQ47_10155 [Pseudomonadota bacterium]
MCLLNHTTMLIFEIRFGRFSILATRGMDRFKNYGFTRLKGEFIMDTTGPA